MDKLKYKILKSPVGLLKAVVNHHSLLAILWDNEKPNRVRLGEMEEDENNPLLLATEKQLDEYFTGHRILFDLPIDARGTAFQKDVWNLLNQIPYGKTLTYKDVAEKIQNPQAIRAVGAAIGRNPVSIIIPCHRVIASNGSLTGFAGGLSRKKTLLDLEAISSL